MISSLAWLVVAVGPTEGVVLVPVAVAAWSFGEAMRPLTEKALAFLYRIELPKLTVMVLPVVSAVVTLAENMSVRVGAELTISASLV